MLLKWKLLPIWIIAACAGTGIAVHTLGDDASRNDALPPLPPLPGANRQTAQTPPALTPPQNVTPRMRVIESNPPAINPPAPATPTPDPLTLPAPNTTPAPSAEIAPPPAELPGGPAAPVPNPYAQKPRPHRDYQPNNGVDPSLYYAEGGRYGGNYPNPIGSPYYHAPNWSYSGGDGYEVHFGPGYYRSGEYGHLRYPFYSYRRPWFHPGPAVYVRDTNLHW